MEYKYHIKVVHGRTMHSSATFNDERKAIAELARLHRGFPSMRFLLVEYTGLTSCCRLGRVLIDTAEA